jgi:hypothetical protein
MRAEPTSSRSHALGPLPGLGHDGLQRVQPPPARLSLLFDTFPKLQEGRDRNLLAATLGNDDRNVTSGNPVVQRGMANAQQARSETARDGSTELGFEVFTYTSNVGAGSFLLRPPQERNVLYGFFTFSRSHSHPVA